MAAFIVFCLYFGLVAIACRHELRELRREQELSSRGADLKRNLSLASLWRCG